MGVDSPGEETAGKYAAEVTVSLGEVTNRVNKKWPAARLKKNRLTKPSIVRTQSVFTNG